MGRPRESADTAPVVRNESGAMPGSFAELLDHRSIARLKSWRTFQASGYDRKGGYYDSGNFLRTEPGRRYVLMEADGPGCIDRMWFTYKSPIGAEPYDLLVYVDRLDEPIIRIDLDSLFTGKRRPFLPPLAGLCVSETTPGRYSYVPIGFADSCKVVIVPRAPADQYKYRINSDGQKIPHIYYQITYRRLDPGTPVKTFQWETDKQEAEALAEVTSLWSDAGTSPWPSTADLKTHQVETAVAARRKALLFELAKSGVICGLELSLDRPDNLSLEIFWDGDGEPAVSVPVGPFFACAESGRPVREVRGLWAGYAEGRYYCFLPMPYRDGAKIFLSSQAETTVGVRAGLHYSDETPSTVDGRLHAHRYDYASPAREQPYTVLDAEGRGHFIAITMDRPGNMEGDDSFFVDDETQPSIHGTGTEDFFNFAWGLSHTGDLALHGITMQTGGPVCYRLHLPAAVPFERSLIVKWEHGHDARNGPNLHQGRYSGVVLYYAGPRERASLRDEAR